MLSLFSIATENIFIIILGICFAFILTGTTIIDIFKKRKFSKIYTLITSIVMLIILFSMLRPILDVLYIKGLDMSYIEYVFNNCLILFYQNLFIYIVIFILIFIGNYISYKI